MSNYEEWTELFKSEVQSHLELILQNDYDEHYYASYLKSLEENQEDTISDAHEEEKIVIDNDDKQSSMQTEIIAIVLFSCALLWLLLQVRRKWKNKPIHLDSSKDLPYFQTNPIV
ncbi:hypothetical protein K501DRAFT_283864 [Backusella circina FSU 941]|nr:hypothetical protein K501DRAFT_283864 [Backusella circina FSU 941]